MNIILSLSVPRKHLQLIVQYFLADPRHGLGSFIFTINLLDWIRDKTYTLLPYHLNFTDKKQRPREAIKFDKNVLPK